MDLVVVMENIEQCSVCATPIPVSGVSCDVCQEHIGFPNVRLAIKENEALEHRYQMEMESVKSRGIEEVAADFEKAVDKANVIIARSVTQLLTLVGNENNLISTFHQQVGSGARLAENNEFDPKRDAVESIAHPLYYKNIHYAALSLDNVGVKHYGNAHIKLHNNFIRKRTSFFEENPFNLVTKLGLAVKDTMPEGYRSTWENKSKLAICKYHANLKKGDSCEDDFQKVLLVEKDDADFIEANIFGSIHVKCIEAVTLLNSADKTSKILFEVNKKRFSDMGIKAEVSE
ncbi:MAG: hypothetical protein ACJAXS_001588 [Colwellia sp.]|jgi:hypothetical protein